MKHTRITANQVTASLTIYAAGVTASTTTRTLIGDIIRYGVPGRTSAGLLKVRPGALTFPTDLSRVKLTREHDRSQSRGHLVEVQMLPDRIRAAAKVSDGPAGDDALREASDKTRDGFSFDIVDAVIDGDEIVAGNVIAIGQVGIPAYDDTRIDTVAASQSPAQPTGETMLTAEQRARLEALRAKQTLTADEQAELGTLAALEGQSASQAPAAPAPAVQEPATAPAAVAASVPAVPSGVPAPTGTQIQVNEPNPLDCFLSNVVAALASGGSAAAITAALTDVTSTDHTDIIEAPAWSGELWSGLQYESEFTPLLNSGTLTNWNGAGWRFKTKPVMSDYAGDKAAISSGDVETEPSTYEAARMAVGHDIDRKFYDFPNEAFLRAYMEAVRESWAMKLDAKVRTWITTNAVAVLDGDDEAVVMPTLLKAAAKAVRALKNRRVGRASFVIVNDDDFDTLLDVTKNDVPAFLELFNIDPARFVSSPDVAAGTVLAGVKQTATVRTLPGSPIRVSAQNIANGGIDEAFFGYWAIEEHHTSGIAKVTYTAPAEEEPAA